jgi:hypothetical protein
MLNRREFLMNQTGPSSPEQYSTLSFYYATVKKRFLLHIKSCADCQKYPAENDRT